MAQHPPPQLTQRNFWLWLLISIITFGIGGIIYLYLNFEDLNRLDKYPRPSNVPSTSNSAVLLIVLLLFVPLFGVPIVLYIKFNTFHRYSKLHPVRTATNVPSGGKVVSLIIFDFLSTFCSPMIVRIKLHFFPGPIGLPVHLATALFGVIGLVLTIFLLIYNYQWQAAYNERVGLLATPQSNIPIR